MKFFKGDEKVIEEKIKVGSMFAGIGGIDLGFEQVLAVWEAIKKVLKDCKLISGTSMDGRQCGD